LLVDCTDAPAADRVLKPFLRARGVNRLPTVLLTHGDVRHVGGAEILQREFMVGEWVTSGQSFRSPEYRKLLDPRTAASGIRREVQRGDWVGLWEVLHPAATDKFDLADDKAIVLRGGIDGTRVLLVSDLGRLGERALLEREPDLRADILIGGTSSGGEVLGAELLQRVQPRILLVSAPDVPASERPSPRLRQRLADAGVPVMYLTDEQSITIEWRRGVWRIRTMAGHSVLGGRSTP
jgi:competence protein ComEC